MIWKYNSGTGSFMFANAAFWGFLPNTGQTLRFYGPNGQAALDVPAGTLNVVVGGTLTQNSDARIKTDIHDLPASQCQAVFDSIEARTYKRTDIETDKLRCGFIAQEVQKALPESMQNIVAPYTHTSTDENGQEIHEEHLGVDYARLAAVTLWGVCKAQQAQLTDLTARIAALEGGGKRKAKHKAGMQAAAP